MTSSVVYTIVRENLDDPLIQSQVLDPLRLVAKERRIVLLWLFRLDYLIRGGQPISALRASLAAQNIQLVVWPFISGRFPVPVWLLPLVAPQWMLAIGVTLFRYRVSILHCRSYNAALAGLYLNRVFSRIKLVFDPRSPYPEECVAAGNWPDGGRSFQFWKRKEQQICRSARAIVAISRPFATSLNEGSNDPRYVVIPNNYPSSFLLSEIVDNDIEAGQQVEGSDEEEPPTICYVGSLGHWNRVEDYLHLFDQLHTRSEELIRLLFVVPKQCRRQVEDALLKYSMPLRECVEMDSVPQTQVADRIKGCVAGLQLMSVVDDRLSVKCVEYLAAGVPVIVSENVRGAAHVVETAGVGIVLANDALDIDDVWSFVQDVEHRRDHWRDLCREFASDTFSPNAVAERLDELYDTV
ncbi:MAG: glycosyltransferase [Pseudomonadota bacterium]